MSSKDWDKIAKIEQAISKKYGTEAIQNPKANWDDEKESEYLEQLRRLAKKEYALSDKNNYPKIKIFYSDIGEE